LLNTIPDSPPLKQLYMAFSFISMWNYKQATKWLEDYLNNSQVTDYHRLIGQVNLAACLVEQNKIKKANQLLVTILKTSNDMDYTRIYANCLELKAQLNHQRNPSLALKFLSKAEAFLPAKDSIDGFFISKWKNLALCYQNDDLKFRTKKIQQIVHWAQEFGHYESLRQLDLHQIKLLGKTELVSKLYYGTPFPNYKTSLEYEFADLIETKYFYQLGPKGKYQLRPNQYSFLTQGLVGQLFSCLTSDFYRPFSTIKLFNSLFSNEYYNPATSKNKIYQLVNRLNLKFASHEIPLTVVCEQGLYSLKSDKGCQIDVSQNVSSSKYEKIINLIEGKFKNKTFTLKQASNELNIPERSLSRYLKTILEKKKLVTLGKGRSSKYKIPE
ncbi:hypothetical protein N9N67_12615, partial [Bacteriovoracaceae bacterium]|nr:hypothetical protein [Bacteriovoracaceae bacterium]